MTDHKFIKLSPQAHNLSGNTFGRLIAVGPVGRGKNGHIEWLCICICASDVIVLATDLSRKHTTSCGCYNKQRVKESATSHGMYGSPEYNSWRGMRYRTTNTDAPNWHMYGGRGIKCCEKWGRFENFFADMGKMPSKTHTIDRIDNEGDYTPDNCRWATHKQQARNRRSNHILTYKGRSLCVTEWAEIIGIKPNTIFYRISKGSSVGDILSEYDYN